MTSPTFRAAPRPVTALTLLLGLPASLLGMQQGHAPGDAPGEVLWSYDTEG